MPVLLMIDNAVGIGLQTLGLGMLMVLGIIAILYIVLKILIPIFSAISGKKTEKTEVPAEPEVPVPAPVQNTVAEEDESDTVAAIVAAIAAFEGKSPESFRVVSFNKRI